MPTPHTPEALKIDPMSRNRFRLPNNLKFTATDPTAAGKTKRTFVGVGYTGDVIPNHWWWGNVVFDLQTMSAVSPLPMLIDHDSSQRAGYSTSTNISLEGGLQFTGNLLSNESGQAVAQDSDDGFPWQMSVGIDPASIEEVSAGTPVVVNGKNLVGPLTIFRNSTVSECSFTATGYDSNTSATAMSRSGSQPEEKTMMTPEEKAAYDALVVENAQHKTQLAEFSSAKRDSDIQAMFAFQKKEYKADDPLAVQLKAMDENQFAATALAVHQFAAPAAAVTTPAAPAAKVVQGIDVTALFSHQADKGKDHLNDPSKTEGDAGANQLIIQAKARAEEFSKSQDRRRR